MHSTPSSQRLELESTSQEQYSLIWNQLSAMKSELEPTDNSSTQNNWSQERKTPPTTSPEDTTPLVKKLLISASTESESSLITALVSKDSLDSTQLEVVLDQDSDHSSWRETLSWLRKEIKAHFHHLPITTSLNCRRRAIQLSPLNSLTLRAHWCRRYARQRSRLWHLQKKLRHWETNLHQLEQTHCPSHLIIDCIPQIRWSLERRCYWIPD